MGALSTNLPLWPEFADPADLAEVEQIPLSERGLPATTYELVTRAAVLWPDRPVVSVLPDAERFHTPLPGRSRSSRTTCIARRPCWPAWA
jgi:hypothetical protein